jgi:hypothetical protein
MELKADDLDFLGIPGRHLTKKEEKLLSEHFHGLKTKETKQQTKTSKKIIPKRTPSKKSHTSPK